MQIQNLFFKRVKCSFQSASYYTVCYCNSIMGEQNVARWREQFKYCNCYQILKYSWGWEMQVAGRTTLWGSKDWQKSTTLRWKTGYVSAVAVADHWDWAAGQEENKDLFTVCSCLTWLLMPVTLFSISPVASLPFHFTTMIIYLLSQSVYTDTVWTCVNKIEKQ